MNKLNNKSGFTLIEIIVVLIIVGILAAIALPNLFSNVAKSKGAEAVNAMGTERNNLEACGQKVGNNYGGCFLSTATAGVASGGVSTQVGNFYYILPTAGACIKPPAAGAAAAINGPIAAGTAAYCIEAIGANTGDNTTVGTDYITLSVTSFDGTANCQGYGRYNGSC